MQIYVHCVWNRHFFGHYEKEIEPMSAAIKTWSTYWYLLVSAMYFNQILQVKIAMQNLVRMTAQIWSWRHKKCV